MRTSKASRCNEVPQQRITALLPIPDAADAGDRVVVYWDNFTGTVDYDAPLTPHPIELFPGQIRARGFGAHPFGVGRIDGTANRQSSFYVQRWGADPWADPPAYFQFQVQAPRGYGLATLGVQIIGPTGGSVGSPLEFEALVSSEIPTPIRTCSLDEYDGDEDRATFAWEELTE